jgi:hypothetical protein
LGRGDIQTNHEQRPAVRPAFGSFFFGLKDSGVENYMSKKLVTDKQLVETLPDGFTTRRIATLRRDGKIPYVKLGYRTLLYDPEKVMAALQRREIKANGM